MFIILIIAIVTRLIFLDLRPMDHDESVHAWISLKNVVESPSYVYDPAFHGPFLYFIISLSFMTLGDSDFAARLPVAIFSILGVYFATRFERWFGKSAYIFSFFTLFSPSMLYYSRYARDDVIVVSSFIAFLYFYSSYREEKKMRYALIASIFLAIIFTSKENWIQYFLVLISAIALEKLLQKKFDFDFNILPCAALFLFFSSFLYSSAFAYAIHAKNWVEVMFNTEWIKRFLEKSLPYWLSQGITSPHEKPIYYFVNILLRYEFLFLALALVSISFRKKFSFFEIFAICWLFVSFIFYHAMVYKTPWLVVHLAAPLAFAAMVFMKEKLEKKEVKIILSIGIVATLLISIQITYFDYNNVEEPLIYVQTQLGAIEMEKRIRELVKNNYSVAVFAEDGHFWPMPWILRREKVLFTTTCPQGYDFVFAVYRDYKCLKGYKIIGSYELRKYWIFYELRKI